MTKKNTIYIATAEFPYGKGETYLESELPYIEQTFDHVVILHGSVSKSKRKIGKNTSLFSNPYQENPSLFNWITLILSKYLYLELLQLIKNRQFNIGCIKTCIISLLNSKRLKKEYYYKPFRNKIKIIPQGFKFKIPENTNYTSLNKVPTFAYSGTFISDIRNPKLLFEYLLQLKIDFKFIIYTSYTNLIEKYRHKLGDKLVIHKPVNRELLLKELGKMDFLINLENIHSPGQVPSKLIDYAIANRPIISVKPDDLNEDTFHDFLKGNFKDRLIMENIEQYHIENICKQFVSL